MTNLLQCGGHRVLVSDQAINKEADAGELLSAAFGNEAEWIAVTTAQLSPDFFRLGTGLAGAVVQKLVNYGCKLAVIGDIEAALAKSAPLRDFVWESNRGHHLWFVKTLDELKARLEGV